MLMELFASGDRTVCVVLDEMNFDVEGDFAPSITSSWNCFGHLP